MPADGWFEWQKSGAGKQHYFIYHRDRQLLFFAVIGKPPFDWEHGREGFVIVTAARNQGMVDIHDRRPLVLTADAVREWLSHDTSSVRAANIARDSAQPAYAFTWHPVATKVGNIHNQGAELIRETDAG